MPRIVIARGAPDCVRWVARAVRADLARTLKLLGCESVAELDGSYVHVPRDFWREP